MVVCYKCGKEMKCSKNGIGVRYGESHVYPGDLYICICCGKQIILTESSPVHDPDKAIITIKGHESNDHCEICNPCSEIYLNTNGDALPVIE